MSPTFALIDTHAHLNSEQLVKNRHEIVDRAIKAGIEQIICIGIDAPSSRQALEIAEEFDQVSAVVGIQPNYCHSVSEDDFAAIVEMASSEKVVGIGETGLDLYWDECPLETQRVFFRRHIDLSIAKDKPFVVHMRDCSDEIVQLLQEFSSHSPLRGVMHSFTGDWKCAKACLDLGLHISFAGMVTFKNAGNLRSVAQQIPEDKILVETDSPYLSPEPMRNKRPNEPSLLIHTAGCLAELRETPFDRFARQTTENAKMLFGI